MDEEPKGGCQFIRGGVGPSGERRPDSRCVRGFCGTERRRDLGRQRVCGLEVGTVPVGLRCYIGLRGGNEKEAMCCEKGRACHCAVFLFSTNSVITI